MSHVDDPRQDGEAFDFAAALATLEPYHPALDDLLSAMDDATACSRCGGGVTTDYADDHAGLCGPCHLGWMADPACLSCTRRLRAAEAVRGYLCNVCERRMAGQPAPELGDWPMPAGRYDGRHVDLAALLAQPPKPTAWRVRDFVADGTLTILSGESGSGKSWLAQALCTGVARGEDVAGIACTLGRALYVDGEMGDQMFVERLRSTGILAPEFEYIDATGLDLSKRSPDDDLDWLKGEVRRLRADLVVIDSLKALSASKAENESDHMAPLLTSIRLLSRETGAAVVLIHHQGGDPSKLYRGSTAIKDQTDALFGLLRPVGEQDLRCLRCQGGGKMRYAPEPTDLYLTLDPALGGVVAANAPEKGHGADDRARQVLEAVEDGATSLRAIAAATGISKNTVDRLLKRLAADGAVSQTATGWDTAVGHLNPQLNVDF